MPESNIIEVGQNNPQMYNKGNATIDQPGSQQLATHFFQKKALITAKETQYFTQLADVEGMPKHMGKEIKRYEYVPLLDDENINDQGIDANGVKIDNGNLYGSSRDIGTITSKLPVLHETGGRVNRVGFSRKVLTGSFEKFGFFYEYTQESVDFDSDSELLNHINRETITGASKINEDSLQIDLINAAGTVRYAGSATSISEVAEEITYSSLMRLGIELDNNRTPKQTTVITGTRMVDTKTIPAARVLYVGSELLPTIKAMKDLHEQPAFVPVQQYAAGTTTLTGEVGAIDQFRIVVVPEMVKWEGKGAASADPDYYGDGTNLDVFPMLVVGDKSFNVISFQTDGKNLKFTQYHQSPGKETASHHDPYGEKGFMSIKWYYGFMATRPERIALVYTAAKM